MTDAVLSAVSESWGWTGIEPAAITATSPFGHLIIRDQAGAFWYLDPELRSLERIANDEPGLFAHMREPDVREIWEASALVDAARSRLGDPGSGKCYSLVPEALIEGNYAPENLWIISVAELVRFTGDFEHQTRDLPDGSTIALKVVD